MEEIRQAAEIRRCLAGEQGQGRKISLVPTMGYFHDGHLALIREAKRLSDVVVVSVFVNPTQFGPHEDFDAYPKDIIGDRKLAEAAGVDYLFRPGTQEMYPPGYATFVEVEKICDRLCGTGRPGHFRGVATIVAKLFVVVRPDVALFGEKDFQQLQVIKRLTADLGFDIRIVAIPTVREPNGLALSSRNDYLSSEERRAAGVLYRSLRLAVEAVDAGEDRVQEIRGVMVETIRQESLVRLEYLSFCDPDNLDEVDRISTGGTLIALAARVGKARLIDNALVHAPVAATRDSRGPEAASS